MAKLYLAFVLFAVIAVAVVSSAQAESEFDEEDPFRGPQEVLDNHDDTLELQPRMKSWGQGEHRGKYRRKLQKVFNPAAYRQEKMYRKQQKYGSMGGMNNGMYPQQQMYQRQMYQQPYQQPMGMQQYPQNYY